MYKKKSPEEVSAARRKAAAISAKIRHANAKGRVLTIKATFRKEDCDKIRALAIKEVKTHAEMFEELVARFVGK